MLFLFKSEKCHKMECEEILTYEFLNNFHKRSEIIAIVDFLTERISRKHKFREYELSGSQAVNLVMLVLCFIMEKSLVEEACTKQDIAGFIRRMDVSFLRKNLKEEEYPEIADYLIKDCLQNSGIPHYFITYNFERREEEKINVKLIDDKRIQFGGEGGYSYYMTPQGYKFMFNTLEIEESLQISIEQFKLSLSIKKRNFSNARNSVDNLFNISTTQIQKINYFIKKVKEDIGNAGIEEYERIYNTTFSSLEEQKSGYDSLYELIASIENSLEEGVQEGNNQVLKQETENVFYIKGRLKQIISEQSKLLLKQQELQKIYNEAVDEMLCIGFENRMNFENIVVKRLEENMDLSFPLIKVLRPLFKPSVNKFYNLQKALKEQKIHNNETVNEGNSILMSDKYFSRLESENEIKIRTRNEQYLNIFESICKYTLLSKDRELGLDQLLIEADRDYDKLVPDIKILTSVLLKLSNLREIDFSLIMEQKNTTVFHPTEEFDAKYCVLGLLDKSTSYGKIKKLTVLLSRTEKIFIPEQSPKKERDQENPAMEIGLHCPNILFKMEVNDFE